MTGIWAGGALVLGVAMCASALDAKVYRSGVTHMLTEPWRNVREHPEWPGPRRPGVHFTGLGIAGFLLILALGGLGMLISLFCLLALPRLLLSWLGQRRRQAFEKQLPGLLETLAAALASGQSLAQAVQMIATQYPAPGRDVFAAASQRMQVGAIGADAFSGSVALGGRTWQMYLAALDVLTERGGSIADVTRTAASTIRRRQRILQRLQTLTAQGKAQAMIMGVLPLFMLAIMRKLDPQLFESLLTSVFGWLLLLAAGVLHALALVLIRKILAIHV